MLFLTGPVEGSVNHSPQPVWPVAHLFTPADLSEIRDHGFTQRERRQRSRSLRSNAYIRSGTCGTLGSAVAHASISRFAEAGSVSSSTVFGERRGRPSGFVGGLRR